MTRNPGQNRAAPHSPNSSPDHRVNKIGVRFRQVQDFLFALHQAQPEHAAAAHGDLGLPHLVARVARGYGLADVLLDPCRRDRSVDYFVLGIEESDDARHAIRFGGDESDEATKRPPRAPRTNLRSNPAT
jgi:hypothetical protein